jgi:hypothetical protein
MENRGGMRDIYLRLIISIPCPPNIYLKFYHKFSKVSRGTFFKVKSHLEAKDIIRLKDRKQPVVGRVKGADYVEKAYPGLLAELKARQKSIKGSMNLLSTADKNNGVVV